MSTHAFCESWTCLNCGKVWISATGWTEPAWKQRCGRCGKKRVPDRKWFYRHNASVRNLR